MTLPSLLAAAFLLGATGLVPPASGQAGSTPSTQAAAPARIRPAAPVPSYSTAPYAKRLAAAQSVKVMTSILGVKLGSTLEAAHEKLDKLCDAAHRPKEEKEEDTKEGEQKVLWELARTNYSFVFVKADDKGQITYVSGFLRPGKTIPFEKIGETDKAPLQDSNTIAWDVLRPKRPLCRVVASGANREANSIILFVVKRPVLQAGVADSD